MTTQNKIRKTRLTTTFNRLRDAGACTDGYRKLAKYLGGVDNYGADTPINLLTILESNGLEDTIWCLRATEQNSDKVARLFAADCAEEVLPLFLAVHPDDDRPRLAIEAARAYTRGETGSTAGAAAGDAARAAAWVAARAAARAAAVDRQIVILRKYLAADRKVK